MSPRPSLTSERGLLGPAGGGGGRAAGGGGACALSACRARSPPPTHTPCPFSHRALARRLLRQMRNPDWEDYRFEYSSLKFVQRADGRALELGRGATGVVKKVRARARVGLEFGRPCTCLTDCGHARSHAPQVVVDGVQTFAAKIVELPGPTAQRLFLKEVALLFRLRHKNVVAFTGVCTHEDTGILLMEVRVGGPARAGAPPRAWLTRAPPLPSPPPPPMHPPSTARGATSSPRSTAAIMASRSGGRTAGSGFCWTWRAGCTTSTTWCTSCTWT